MKWGLGSKQEVIRLGAVRSFGESLIIPCIICVYDNLTHWCKCIRTEVPSRDTTYSMRPRSVPVTAATIHFVQTRKLISCPYLNNRRLNSAIGRGRFISYLVNHVANKRNPLNFTLFYYKQVVNSLHLCNNDLFMETLTMR